MKIPKEVAAALRKRTRAAMEVMDGDAVVTRFIEDNGIEVDTDDYGGGLEMYTNPWDSEERIRAAIKAHKENAL